MNRFFGRKWLPRFFLLAYMFLAVGLTGCGERTLDVNMRLITKGCHSSDALDGVGFLRITVSGDGLEQPMPTTATVGSGEAVLLDIPLGGSGETVRRRIDIEGTAHPPSADDPPPVMARGTAVVDMPRDSTSMTINVFLRPVDRFGLTGSAEQPDLCTEMGVARFGHTSTVLRDGRVLIVGGAQSNGDGDRTVLSSAELFNPSTGEFSPISADHGPAVPRAFHTATLLRDGRVLIAGGEFDSADHNYPQAHMSAEIYDPAEGRFVDAFPAPRTRARHTATRVSGDVVLLIGGYESLEPGADGYPVPTSSMDIFVGETTSFVSAAEGAPVLPVPRAEHCAVANQSEDLVLIAGGITVNGEGDVAVSQTFSFLRTWRDEQLNQRFEFVNSDAEGMAPRYALACGVVREAGGVERAVMAGGFGDLDESSPYARVESVTLELAESAQASSIDGTMSGGSMGNVCASDFEGSVLLTGGRHGDGTAVELADRLSYSQERTALQSVRGRMSEPRFDHSCVTLLNGSVLVTGGRQGQAGAGSLSAAEIYMPIGR